MFRRTMWLTGAVRIDAHTSLRQRRLPEFREPSTFAEVLDVAVVEWLVEAFPEREQSCVEGCVQEPVGQQSEIDGPIAPHRPTR